MTGAQDHTGSNQTATVPTPPQFLRESPPLGLLGPAIRQSVRIFQGSSLLPSTGNKSKPLKVTATKRKSLHQGNGCRCHSHAYVTIEKAERCESREGRDTFANWAGRPALATAALGKAQITFSLTVRTTPGAGLRTGPGGAAPRGARHPQAPQPRPRARPRCALSVTAGQLRRRRRGEAGREETPPRGTAGDRPGSRVAQDCRPPARPGPARGQP